MPATTPLIDSRLLVVTTSSTFVIGPNGLVTLIVPPVEVISVIPPPAVLAAVLRKGPKVTLALPPAVTATDGSANVATSTPPGPMIWRAGKNCAAPPEPS